MKEIYIQSKCGNNLLRKLREQKGLSKASLAREAGIEASRVGELENFKISPRKKSPFGTREDIGWRKDVIILANFFSVEPEDIFPESTWYLRGEKPVVREISISEIMALTGESTLRQLMSPEEMLDEKDRHDIIDRALSNLTPREERVLRLRFGIGFGDEDVSTHSYKEVGQDFEVTRERIRQIEAKALRKLRHPKNKEIKQYYSP